MLPRVAIKILQQEQKYYVTDAMANEQNLEPLIRNVPLVKELEK